MVTISTGHSVFVTQHKQKIRSTYRIDMQRFKDISKKIVSIKALTKKKYLDSEEKGDTVSTKVTRESILTEVRLYHIS